MKKVLYHGIMQHIMIKSVSIDEIRKQDYEGHIEKWPETNQDVKVNRLHDSRGQLRAAK